MTARNSNPESCPKCGASMDGGPIPDDIRHHYRPPFRWCRAILLKVLDGKERWKCPDCNHEWR